jgi:probable rRNA maturation factor
MPITLAKAGAARPGFPPAARARLAAYARAVLASEGVARAAVGIVFADDAELRRLNADYRGIDRATDVLSFTYADDGPGAAPRHLEGELYLSTARIAAQAKRYRHTPGAELLRLVTHGLLHLCGHDHVKAGERRIMRAAERRALKGDLPRGGAAAFEAIARAALRAPAGSRAGRA